jgi:predicted ATPase
LGLTDIHITGYRSVRTIHMPVRQLSVLVGANGVGKTNLYRALELVRHAATGELTQTIMREGGLASAMWAGERRAHEAPRIHLKVDLDGVIEDAEFSPSYEVEIGFGDSKYQAVFADEPQIKSETLSLTHGRTKLALMERKGEACWIRDEQGRRRQLDDTLLASETALSAIRGAIPEIDAVRYMLTNWRFYHGFRTDAGSPLRQPAHAITSPMLDADGSNLAAVFATLAHIRADTTDLSAAVEHAFPGTKLNLPYPGTTASFSLTYPDFPYREFGATELSDGTLQFLALMGALLAYRLPPLIALNEPETSLHPDLLPALARIIAKAAERTQVWVVTHSQPLADALKQETGIFPRRVVRQHGGTWIEGLRQFGDFDDED